MAAHASQIAPDDFFLSMPDEVFAGAFGTEWFVAPGRRPAPVPTRPTCSADGLGVGHAEPA